jgi:dTDP-4-amino-4,6-dideoxygalactose transaminase
MTIPLFKPFIAPPDELMPALQETLYSGYISEGPKVKEFEEKFAEFIGVRHALAFSSGTAALHVALVLAGVKPGDEVISTPMTAEPTNTAIMQTGAKIVWADVDPKNGNIDPVSVKAKITERTRAVVVVHYGGIPVDMYGLSGIDILVISDCAHALGARYASRPIASFADYAMFSLQAIKHLTTGDGGVLVAFLPDDIAYARRLRFFGIDRQAPRTEVDVTHLGYKYNMNDVIATMGLVQLRHAQWVVDRHIENGRFFDEALKGIPGLELCQWNPIAKPSYWFYTVLAENRDGLSKKLTEVGIGNGQVHRRNDWHTVFAGSKCKLLGLDEFWGKMLHVPCGWWLTEEDRGYIVGTIRGGW